MAVVEFVSPKPGLVAVTAGVPECFELARTGSRLRLYGRVMRLCFILVLASWASVEIGCLLSLFLHFKSGIVVGTINGTLTFKFWPFLDYFSPDHARSNLFVPHIFPLRVKVTYSIILIIASAPFCAFLLYLERLFTLYSHGEVFAQRNVIVLRRIGHCSMATGYSPLLLGPAAHAIGVLKPVTGVTDGMIMFVFLGLTLLAISHVMRIGQRMQQDQEDIL